MEIRLPGRTIALAGSVYMSTTKELFMNARGFGEYVAGAEKNQKFWQTVYDRAAVPADIMERAHNLPGAWHLLVLSEDWCGDAANTVPVLARFAAQTPNVDLRILARDQNAELMDSHLTNGARSIPVVMVLDAKYRERGWWGPRPTELQKWFEAEGRQMEPEDRYLEIRRWYARDKGASTLDEVVSLIEEHAHLRASA